MHCKHCARLYRDMFHMQVEVFRSIYAYSSETADLNKKRTVCQQVNQNTQAKVNHPL